MRHKKPDTNRQVFLLFFQINNISLVIADSDIEVFGFPMPDSQLPTRFTPAGTLPVSPTISRNGASSRPVYR
ncbi:MAG: hypothetical protein KF888_12690 [Nitrosomonas sp.]|nr:hypothetical protein [Nitrosomonas sp.]